MANSDWLDNLAGEVNNEESRATGAGADEELLQAIKAADLYLRADDDPGDEDKHFITCPWHDYHSDTKSLDTFVRDGSGKKWPPLFHCSHAHSQRPEGPKEYNLQDLHAWLVDQGHLIEKNEDDGSGQICPYEIPYPYVLAENGVSKQAEDKPVRKVTQAPVWIDGRATDVNDGTVSLKLKWRRGTEELELIVPREQALNQHKLVHLAANDFPVTGVNAADLVGYLDAFEAVNRDNLPHEFISSRPGWQGEEGSAGFLWGDTHLFADGRIAAAGDSSRIRFAPLSPGDEQAVNGLNTAGTFDDWAQAVLMARPYPKVLVALFASLAVPLLPILGAPSFCLHYGGQTTSGKTTSLRIAASVWGNPSEIDASLLSSWDSTTVGIERLCALRNGIPLILDDTSRVSVHHSERIREVVYLIANGRGRTRGAMQGAAKTDTWRTILLSSGEEALRTHCRGFGGSVMRTLELNGLPFGERTVGTERTIETLTQQISKNFGHAGFQLVAYLLAHRSRWGQFRRWHENRMEHYRAQSTSEEGVRIIAYVATLDVAARLAHEVLGLTSLPTNVGEAAWEGFKENQRDPADAIRALQIAYSWAESNRHRFYDGRTRAKPDRVPMAGRWDTDQPERFDRKGKLIVESAQWQFIGFFPHVLEEVLRSHRFPPDATIERWDNLGWLDREGKQRQPNVRLGLDKPKRLYCILRSALDQVGLGTDPVAPDLEVLDDDQARDARK